MLISILLITQRSLCMKIAKLLIPAALACSLFGFSGTVDAATGIVNLNQVLAGDSDFQAAAKAFAKEQTALQNDFNKKAQSMNDAQKKELAEKYNKQLDQKDKELIKPVQDRINAAVAQIAKEKNLDTVVIPGGYVYGKIDVDITQDVQKALKK